MDKFGIFNLINSFVSEYKSKNPSPTQSATIDWPTPAPEKISKPLEPLPLVPLKKELLDTIKNHDEFVKRVQKNFKKY